VQALIDNLIERGLDPKVCRLFIVDGAKALSKVIPRDFVPWRFSTAGLIVMPAPTRFSPSRRRSRENADVFRGLQVEH
jgi:hypothetical protein